jgi:hypothetical protein
MILLIIWYFRLLLNLPNRFHETGSHFIGCSCSTGFIMGPIDLYNSNTGVAFDVI